jgi:hypothetical protein
MVKQGEKIYSAIYKRIWRSMKQEFKKWFILNAIHLPAKQSFGVDGAFAMREDYLGDPSKVIPVADPNVSSDEQKFVRAQLIADRAGGVPGYDREVAERRFLDAAKIEGTDQLYPGVKKTGPLGNPKIQVEQMKMQAKQSQLEWDKKVFAAEMQSEVAMNQAKITELMAKAAMELEQAGGVKEGHKIAMFEAAIGAMKQHNDNLNQRIELMIKGMDNEQRAADKGASGVPGVANASDNSGASAMGAA